MVCVSAAVGAFAKADGPLALTKHPYDAHRRVQAYQALEAKDPLGRKKLRPKFPGSHRSILGAQLDQSCITEAMKELGATRYAVTQAFERLIVDSYLSVDGCKKDYPELNLYLGQWISLFRRTVYLCSPNEITTGLRYAAMSVPSGTYVKEMLGKSFKEYFDFSPTETRSLPRSFRPIVLWSHKRFPRYLKSYFADIAPVSLESRELVIHETLHATEANNRLDHNEIEFKITTADDKLGEDMTADRIITISALCSHSTLASFRSAPQSVFRRTEDLGYRDGCENLFTGETQLQSGILGSIDNSWNRYYLPSKGLPLAEAGALCQKLQLTGRCDDLRYGKLGLEAAARDSVLEAQGEILRRRLDALFPPNAYGLSVALLEKLPDSKDYLEDPANSACVNLFFSKSSSGNFILKTTATPARGLRPSSRLIETLGFLTTPAPTQCSVFADELRRRVLSQNSLGPSPLSFVLDSTFLKDMVEERYFHRGEKELYEVFLPNNLTLSGQALLGPEIANAYFEALKTRHPKSFSYKCPVDKR